MFKTHFYKLFQVATFWGVTMATKLQKVHCKICLNRKVKFLNNSVIFKDIEPKFGIWTNFGPLNSKNNIKVEFDVIMMS